MTISFAPHSHGATSTPTFPPYTGEMTDTAHYGISDPYSTLSPSVHESDEGQEEGDGGFCGWLGGKLGEIWRSILACFSFGGSRTGEGAVEDPVADRIAKGQGMIDRHLNEILQLGVNPSRSVAVFVMKYNNRTETHFRKVDEFGQSRIAEFAKEHLRAFLARGDNARCADGRLEIETLIFEKNLSRSFDYSHANSFLIFPDGSYSGAGNGTADNLSRATVFNLLTIAVPSAVDRQGILDLLVNRL